VAEKQDACSMNDKQSEKHLDAPFVEVESSEERATSPCPAGDDNCPNISEVAKLRKEVERLDALVRTDKLTGLFNWGFFNQALSL